MGRRNQGPRLRWLNKRGCYYVTWTENGRSRERSTGHTDRGNAEAFFAEWLHLRQRDGGPRDPTEVLITDLLADYAEERGAARTNPERIGYAIVPLTEFWQGKTAGEIDEGTCADFQEWRARSPGTMRRELGVLRAAINHAHKRNRITRQVPVELPEAPPAKDRWLTRSEAARLLWAARKTPKARRHLTLFILIGLYTGKRKEAILSLRWPKVDLQRGIIDWEIEGRPRTKKQRGKNPVNPKLLAHLRRARRWGSDLGPVVAYEGKPVGNIKKSFAAAATRAELTSVTPHVLRHTCCTWLAQAGVPLWVAAGYVGMTVETFTRVYGHHHPDYQQEAARAF